MAFTVKRLAAMSGVSVRTLHFYDEAGLLAPAYHGKNGYRFYEEAQLLRLQQILFYRELGLELKQIRKILDRSDFDRIEALESHRRVLDRNLAHTRKLIRTIDKTIAHLKGTRKMKSEDLFVGFSPEEQAKHEQYLVDRFGEGMKQGIAQSKARVKHWKKSDWVRSGTTFAGICADLVAVMARQSAPGSGEAQAIVRRHFEWLKQFWTPTRESYAGHSQLVEDSELSKAYAFYHPELPRFMAAAIRTFAERELK